MKKVLLFIFSILLLCSCAKKEEKSMTFEDIQKEDNYIIVDVRTPEEYESGHVVGAINVPYDVILESDLDKDKTIVVYCRSGNRSSIAYNALIDNGYDAFDLGAYEEIDLEKE